MNSLAASLLALAPNLIGPTIRAVEAIFGPKTGAAKMDAVVAALLPLLKKAAAAGKIPGIPDEATLRTVIEAVFQRGGDSDVCPSDSSFKYIQVPAGSTITIQVPPDIKAEI